MFDLNGQVALVTGASRGIGEKIAERLATCGTHTILASRNLKDVEKVAGHLKAQGLQAEAMALDITDSQNVQEAVAAILQRVSKIDILVNNAGITRDTLLLRMKEEDWETVMSTNLDGLYRVTRAVIGTMVRNRYGRIINLTSVVALAGNPGQTNYAASKAGVVGFTKALAREVASRGITVNALAPGYIETQMTSGLGTETRRQLMASIPLGRIGTPEDVAWGALFLASKEAGYITGHVLNINGGMYM